MGLPKILIEFKTLAETLIARSERGIVAVILKDNSNTTKTAVYTKESEIVKSHYTAINLAYRYSDGIGIYRNYGCSRSFAACSVKYSEWLFSRFI